MNSSCENGNENRTVTTRHRLLSLNLPCTSLIAASPSKHVEGAPCLPISALARAASTSSHRMACYALPSWLHFSCLSFCTRIYLCVIKQKWSNVFATRSRLFRLRSSYCHNIACAMNTAVLTMFHAVLEKKEGLLTLSSCIGCSRSVHTCTSLTTPSPSKIM